jgi:hypothetical protein
LAICGNCRIYPGKGDVKKKSWGKAVRCPRSEDSVVVSGVNFGEICFLGRQILKSKHGISGANGDTSAAVDTRYRIDVKLGQFIEPGPILLGVNAIHRASRHAELVFRAGIDDYLCHMPTGLQFPGQPFNTSESEVNINN